MRRIMDPHQFRTWVAFLLLITAAIVIFHAVSHANVFFGWLGGFFRIISPFIVGFMIAYVLGIPRESIERLLAKTGKDGKGWVVRRKRGLSVLITYVVSIAMLWFLSSLVFPHIYANITDFIAFLPTLVENISGWVHDLQYVEGLAFIDINWEYTAENITLDNLMELFSGLFTAENIAQVAGDTIVAAGSFLFRSALALISSIYFMLEGQKVGKFGRRALRSVTSTKVYATIVKYGREINQYFKRYIYCQVLDAVILGTIMTIALTIMGASYALALGPMLGVANLIPYFGAIVGTMAAFVIILVADGPQLGVIAGVVMVIIQQVDANFIFPRLLGGSLKISPLLVIIGISIGGAYYGIIGMVVAIPIATVIRNIIEDLMLYRESRKMKKSESEVES